MRTSILRAAPSVGTRWSPLKIKHTLALAVATLIPIVPAALGDTISFSGQITQSTENGTGPAVNNPDLNKIATGDAYAVTLDFLGSIAGPGNYPLAGTSMLFRDLNKSVNESSFGQVTVSVLTDGSFFDISMVGCLTTGDCNTGNSLNALFQIPAAGLNSQNVAAQALFGLTPLDLLEDVGVTDIQGSVSAYSYIAKNPVPEPSTISLLCGMLAALIWIARRRAQAVPKS